ncbi:MAG: molybdopterin-dependent oxidoreductase [Myxococcota bacterium]
MRRRRFLSLAAGGAIVAACEPTPSTSPSTDEGDTGEPSPAAAREVEPITSNEEFYVTSHAGTPTVDGATWTLDLDGQATVDLAGLAALPARDKEHTLVCIGSTDRFRAMDNAVWTGMPLAEVLEALGVRVPDDATEIQIDGADGYQQWLPVADLPEVWLVWEMNGEPLPPNHGYPLRMLVPDRYGMKNPKWVTRIAFSAEHRVGTWEAQGWSETCEIRPAAWAHFPADGEVVAEGVVPIAGSAYCGRTPIAKVEVSADAGDTWTEADLVYVGPDDTWTTWRLDWTPPGPGTYTLRVRCEAADGRTTDPAYEQDLAGFTGEDTFTVTVV